ncbi:uncharacterized protein ColSpa_10986 [Colletotrichum spaethianum]|uniref:Uncharacterized protein n=1 Tax=Colletotrichum spaethianum TaxID=700344 RepID=A0AA37UPJ4_9PEZI|nr:uncharacterized protein ColSpa_10986 [Colletotrichum spaethianum]GKT50805.1 hypothetical protein ColSpa_10986 [Colletotrichum spaethianum]
MASPRSLAIRRVALARPLPRATAPLAVQQVRWITQKPGDGDLGGPGGQEPVPSSSGPSQSWPTLAAIGAVGLAVGGYLVHLTGKSKGQGTTMEKGEFDKLAARVTPRQ